MKNKIYNAIKTGLYKVLSADIMDQDIDFDKDDINNDGGNLINNYYQIFMENRTEDNYSNIIRYSKNTGYKYKPSSWQEVLFITSITSGYTNYTNNWIDISDIKK